MHEERRGDEIEKAWRKMRSEGAAREKREIYRPRVDEKGEENIGGGN